MSRYPTTILAALTLALLAPLAATGCGEEAITLPADYSTGRYWELTVSATAKKSAPIDLVKALNGVDGSPKPVVTGDFDLKTAYWGRGFDTRCGTDCLCPDQVPGSACPDGLHTSLVRVGTDTLCEISLEEIFPNSNADRNNPANYDFDSLDQHVRAASELNTAYVVWNAAFNPGGTCKSNQSTGEQLGNVISTAAQGELWADVAYRTLLHLRGGKANDDDPDDWDTTHETYTRVNRVEFLRGPIARMGYGQSGADPSWARLFETYRLFVERVKNRWPDNLDPATLEREPVMHVGGMSFELERTAQRDDLSYTSAANKHPVLAFIDYCERESVPLDFLSFATISDTAYNAMQLADTLRDYLDKADLEDTKLILTGMQPKLDLLSHVDILADERFANAHLGAFQTAVRIFTQDVPVDYALAGRGPRVYDDFQLHQGVPVDQLDIIESSYFESDGLAKPAYLAIFPFRQVKGQQRVTWTNKSADPRDFALMASHSTTDGRILHLVLANADVDSEFAEITYDLTVHGLDRNKLVRKVDYKLAILDRNSFGTGAFHFSETGTIDANESTGAIRFVHWMAVPSVHYLVLDARLPSEKQ